MVVLLEAIRKYMKIIILLLLISSQVMAARKVTTNTGDGLVVGTRFDKYTHYQSIPYAKPPVGELRWKAPRKLERRSYVWDGRGFETRCAQMENLFSGTQEKKFGEVVGSEDCLYLNIWAPKTRVFQKKPVFLWIHGGSNFKGVGADELYDGKNLAPAVDAVVVTINYRLGLLGAFTHSDFNQENELDNSGNYTTLDILAALDWVRENIKYFGGDKNNITIAGESAGCMNVWGLLQTPLAKDKFHKAYCASGIPNNYPKIVSNRVGANLVNKAKKARGIQQNLKGDDLKDFIYNLSTEEIIKISHGLVPIQHISDGVVFPKLGLGSVLFGNLNRVPLMTGINESEASFFIAPPIAGITEPQLWSIANGESSDQPLFDFINDPIKLAAYNKADEAAFLAMRTTVNTALRAAKIYLPAIYKYELSFTSETEPWKSVFKSAHGLDLPLLFQKREFNSKHFLRFLNDDLKTSRVKTLQKTWAGYLKNFIYTGDPNGDGLNTWENWSLLPWKDATMKIRADGFTPVSDSER